MFYQDSWACTALLSWVYMIYFKGGISELICPEVAELDSSVLLTCIHSGPADMVYIRPGGTSAAAICISGICLSNQPNRFSGTVVNMTHSYLEIKKAQLLDEGNWKCRDTSNITSNCSLILRNGMVCATYVGVGVSIGIGITVIIVVIVVVIVMRTRKKQGAKDTEPPSVQGIAGPNLRRQESEFQGIAGPNMGRQESESQDTNNSQPLNNYEDLLPRPGNDYEELRVYNTCH